MDDPALMLQDEATELFKHVRSLLVDFEKKLNSSKKESLDHGVLRRAKELGFSDRRIGKLTGLKEDEVRKLREKAKVLPVWKVVDTCAGEFESETPYFYSTYRPSYLHGLRPVGCILWFGCQSG